MRALAAIGGQLLDFALPARCPGCGAVVDGTHRFCLECWRGLEFLGGPACARCGAPFARDAGWAGAEGECAPCLADPPPYDGVAAAVAYGETARALVLRLKHGRRPGLAGTVARQMRRLVEGREGAVLVPVPLHRWRLWRRGYNQAALIARALSRLTGLDLDVDMLVRARATPMLRDLGPRARAEAVAGAFRASPRARGRRVLLVDDVFTTGATAAACARALKRAGAREARLVCWARVVRGEEDGHVDRRAGRSQLSAPGKDG